MGWYVAPTLDVLLAEVNASAPGRGKAGDGSIGDPAHSSRESDHNPDDKGCVHARDFTHDPVGGFDSYAFADWIRGEVNAGRMRIGYVISNGRIYNPEHGSAWRPYTGSNPHSGHVHVSIKYDHREDDRSPWYWQHADGGQPAGPTLTEMSMFIVFGPGGAGLAAPGYWKNLSGEEYDLLVAVPGMQTVSTNQRGWDVYYATMLQGRIAVEAEDESEEAW